MSGGLTSEVTLIPIVYSQTEIEDIPTSLMAFQGRVVAGIGRTLRLYDLGKKKLLRKCENKVRLHS